MNRQKTTPKIDRGKVRFHARQLSNADILIWLDRAIDLLPNDALPALIADYIYIEKVLSDEEASPSLLTSIQHFHRESTDGRYYQNTWSNSPETLQKIDLFIAEHARLIKACLDAEASGNLEVARKGFHLLIDLLHRIDDYEEIVFFEDEAGSWQIFVHWPEVLPAWFRSLSPNSSPEDWAEVVIKTIESFVKRKRDAFLTLAHEAGTPAQQKALNKYG